MYLKYQTSLEIIKKNVLKFYNIFCRLHAPYYKDNLYNIYDKKKLKCNSQHIFIIVYFSTLDNLQTQKQYAG